MRFLESPRNHSIVSEKTKRFLIIFFCESPYVYLKLTLDHVISCVNAQVWASSNGKWLYRPNGQTGTLGRVVVGGAGGLIQKGSNFGAGDETKCQGL